MRMRTLRMWYGIALIGVLSHVRKLTRETGALLKSYGRKLEHWGDDVTPRWGLKIFNKCYLAEVELHLNGNIFFGLIDLIYQDTSQVKQELVVRLKSVTKRKDAIFDDPLEIVGEHEFRLTGYGAPVPIKKGDYDCVWTGCDEGYLAVYFSRPQKNLKNE